MLSTLKVLRMLMDNNEVSIVDEDCTVGLNIFMFCFELKCVIYCLGDSSVAHTTLLLILVSQIKT